MAGAQSPATGCRSGSSSRWPRPAELADYLRGLGAGAIYLSPILQATSGSDHGYDITSHRPGRSGTRRRGRPERAGREPPGPTGCRSWSTSCPTTWGWPTRRRTRPGGSCCGPGRTGRTGDWFDVDWAAGAGRILLPVLGDDFEADQLSLVDGELRYFEHRFPIAPGTEDGTDPAAVHDRQHYQLVSYRRADTEQNYRRFFAVTELAGIRVEDPQVFERQPRRAAALGGAGRGGRHPGRSPGRAGRPGRLPAPAGRPGAARPGSRWRRSPSRASELPADWPVAGTTGYDALAELNALLYDPAAEQAVTRHYRELTGDDRDWAAARRTGQAAGGQHHPGRRDRAGSAGGCGRRAGPGQLR